MMTRPWGRMWRWFPCRWLWFKIIHVLPRECTSLQQHHRRWEVHIGLARGVYRRWTWHFNYVAPLDHHSLHTGWYLEIAWGHPAEEDITRLTDRYGRA